MSVMTWEDSFCERCEVLAEELEEYETSFRLYDDAIRRGTKLWQEKTGRTETLPDTAALVEWLLTELK